MNTLCWRRLPSLAMKCSGEPVPACECCFAAPSRAGFLEAFWRQLFLLMERRQEEFAAGQGEVHFGAPCLGAATLPQHPAGGPAGALCRADSRCDARNTHDLARFARGTTVPGPARPWPARIQSLLVPFFTRAAHETGLHPRPVRHWMCSAPDVHPCSSVPFSLLPSPLAPQHHRPLCQR